MGEVGLKMTLEALGGITDIFVEVSDDGIMLLGEVTFEIVEVAKVAIEQYNCMDMGMGDMLKMVSIRRRGGRLGLGVWSCRVCVCV